MTNISLHQRSINSADRYFYIWAIFLPITSYVLLPSIQGTTIGFLMAFLSIILAPLLAKYVKDVLRFFYTLAAILMIYLFVILTSQLSLAFSPIIDFSNVILIDPNDSKYLFKSSLFTQSLYMVAAFATFTYVRVFYKENWNKYIFIGAALLAIYGLYEVLFFMITGTSGDFLTNRTFGDGNVRGSAFQKMQLGGLTIMRLKSLTGEPSMYAFTIVPFFAYAAFYLKWKKTSMLLLISLCLSTSSTFIVGSIIMIILGIRKVIRSYIAIYFSLWGVILAFIFMGPAKIYETASAIFLDKIMMKDISGSVRITNFLNHMDFYGDLPFLNKLFGVGFGYVRSTDLFSTLFVNTGFVGFLIFSGLFAYPLIKLGRDKQAKVLKLILITIYLSMMIAVPEYSYLSTWLFLGIAYNKVYQKKLERHAILKEKRTALREKQAV